MNLLMLTKFYPYGTGEAFIENEIEVLSEYYENVTIIACEVAENDILVRPLPTNVTAFKVPGSSKKKDVIYGVPYFFTKDPVVAAERQSAHGILSKAFLCYFESKSQRIYHYIMEKQYIDNFCKKPFVLYSYWFFMTARVGTLIKNQYKPVYMFTRAHRYDLYEQNNRINFLPYRRLFLKSYDSVFPCSANGTQHLKSLYPDLSHNVATSFLGTLNHGIGFGSVDGTFRIVSCSRTEPVKRVIKIVEALQILDDKNMDIEWTHIGDGSELERIKNTAATKLHHIRYMFAGNMKNSDIMKLYQEKPFDLLINVSSSEGLPVSIMEAISFGIPVVATNVGGTSEIVIDGITGKLIPAEFNISELTSVIQDFVSAKNTLIDRNGCRKFWEEHFQAISNYHKMCDFVKAQYDK